jgi:alanine racemase
VVPSPSRRTETLETATRNLNAWIEIDLATFEANLSAIRGAIGSGVEIIAIVKGNAYGHGAGAIARAAEAAGVERFGVAYVPEAVALRAEGITAPILATEHAFPGEAEAIVHARVTPTVHSRELADALSAAASQLGTTARVHIKVDTGLRRFGVPIEEAPALANYCRALPGLEVEGLLTHMANADEADDGFSSEQQALFESVRRQLPWIPYHHAANSATALRRSMLRHSGVRVGLAMHGLLPAHTRDPGLHPTLALKARVARVVDVAPGEGVAYGLTWRARRPSRVALVPVGYADGWRRSLGNVGEVLIGGHRCPMVGRVMMDQFLADATDAGAVAEGDEVVLLGSQGSETITADDVARETGTISWEVLSLLQARLPRVYHRGGAVVPG